MSRRLAAPLWIAFVLAAAVASCGRPNRWPGSPHPARRTWRPMVALRQQVSAEQALARSRAFLEAMRTRRTVRDFSDRPVPFELIRNAVATAATAPSGANLQPWRFVVVADPQRKRRLRAAAEQEERAFYSSRASAEWLAALEPLGTDWRKPFLETAPYVIVVLEVHKGPTVPAPTTPRSRSGSRSGCCSPRCTRPAWPP